MAESVIRLDRLSKKFRNLLAVREVSMEIGEGEIFGFLGANGAGKTTTIRMLCGLAKPTSGFAEIFGFDSWRDRRAIRRRFGYVPQKFSLYPDLTVTENLRFFGSAYQIGAGDVAQRIRQVAENFGLEPKLTARAGSLSGGFKQLLSIGAALLHRPSLLFLDEPTAGLDPVHRQTIWESLYDLSQNGTTIFVTTHYMDEVERCSDVGFIRQGTIIAKNSPGKLKEQIRNMVLELRAQPIHEAIHVIRQNAQVKSVELRNDRLRVLVPDAERILFDWVNHWPFPSLNYLGAEVVLPDMEDVFMAYSLGASEEQSESQ